MPPEVPAKPPLVDQPVVTLRWVWGSPSPGPAGPLPASGRQLQVYGTSSSAAT